MTSPWLPHFASYWTEISKFTLLLVLVNCVTLAT
eukprot:SAG11_NODE_36747_length_260_cov_0.639752_1_plen_33_part_10